MVITISKVPFSFLFFCVCIITIWSLAYLLFLDRIVFEIVRSWWFCELCTRIPGCSWYISFLVINLFIIQFWIKHYTLLCMIWLCYDQIMWGLVLLLFWIWYLLMMIVILGFGVFRIYSGWGETGERAWRSLLWLWHGLVLVSSFFFSFASYILSLWISCFQVLPNSKSTWSWFIFFFLCIRFKQAISSYHC